MARAETVAFWAFVICAVPFGLLFHTSFVAEAQEPVLPTECPVCPACPPPPPCLCEAPEGAPPEVKDAVQKALDAIKAAEKGPQP